MGTLRPEYLPHGGACGDEEANIFRCKYLLEVKRDVLRPLGSVVGPHVEQQ